MEDFRTRTRVVWGDSVDKLATAHVAIAGLGGVGCMAAESLVRAGVEHFTLIDMDTYAITNINRQLFATHETLGRPKTEAAKARMRAINPLCDIDDRAVCLSPENVADCLALKPDIVIDAIDMVSAKLALINYCTEKGIPIISCLGTGNRSDPTQITTGDIADTAGSGCPLARIIRNELRKRGIIKLPVVYSTELPIKAQIQNSSPGRHSPGSTPMPPLAAGLALAHLAVVHLMSRLNNKMQCVKQ